MHFVQKIIACPILCLGPDGFSAHLRNFLQVLDLHIFRQKWPGHWAEVICHFHLLSIFLYGSDNIESSLLEHESHTTRINNCSSRPVYKITDFANLTDFRLAQRRPVVIASPTTGTETTDALPFLYLTQKAQNAQTYFFCHHPFCEFSEFCVP